MKKFTSVIVVLAMLAAMMTAMIPTASAAWDGSSSSVSLMGSGTEIDPYLVSSENDLAFVAKQVNSGATTYAGEFLKLTVDLDLGNKSWTPIADIKTTTVFSGTFDGDGHTISNLKVKTTDGDSNALYGGVFGTVKDAVIKNLSVDTAEVISAKYAGAIAGYAVATKETGYTAIINCHVTNATIRGLQIGGIVGRSESSKGNKGQIEIIGCTADNVTFGYLTDADYNAATKVAYTNHFVGGIVGGAGATVINGCGVTNMTATVFAESFGPCGGILGVQGASSVNSDVVNCYVIGANFNTVETSHVTKTELGGLIGKMGHISSTPGAYNTESYVFNCFVADVTLKGECGTTALGIVVGLQADYICFNDIYYVPSEGLEAIGDDPNFNEYPFTSIASLSELKLENLNKGNSTAVWIEDAVKGHPVIDVVAAEANEPTFVDYSAENPPVQDTEGETTEETTGEKPVEDTSSDETTDTAPAEETTNKTPEANDTTKPADDTDGGCGSVIASGALVFAFIGAAVILKKRN